MLAITGFNNFIHKQMIFGLLVIAFLANIQASSTEMSSQFDMDLYRTKNLFKTDFFAFN